MPPNGGFGGNTGVQDAFNLAWKIAHVLQGEAGPALLDTYDTERQPIGRLTIEQAYTRYVLRTAPYLGTDHIQPIADDLSLEIGHRYRSAAVVQDRSVEDDGLPYVDPRESRGLPGTRAPHLWIEPGVSTLDLFRRNMVLLTADHTLQPPTGIDLHVIDHPDFPEAYAISPSGAVLVRPDGYVAWRSREAPTTEAIKEALGSVLCVGSRAAA
jgi:hypothetical protein